MDELSPRFIRGYEAIKSLSKHPRYQAAFIFGSVAEGTSNAKSDLDVQVVVNKENLCENVNHPIFDDYKLDISFRSFAQIKKATDGDVKSGERQPTLATANIVFDKTGELTNLQKTARKAKPKTYSKKDHLFTQFMLYHANDKVERCLDDDPLSSLYSMHANIGDVLKNYYRLNGKWWVSSKRILSDLETWDKELAHLVKSFVSTADLKKKHAYWSAIIDHVTKPMGGRQPISENNCNCEVCKIDLSRLTQNSGA